MSAASRIRAMLQNSRIDLDNVDRSTRRGQDEEHSLRGEIAAFERALGAVLDEQEIRRQHVNGAGE